jgi:hypothetical protein
MLRLGQSVRSAEATPAAAYGSRRRALLARLPTDDEILSSISQAPAAPIPLAIPAPALVPIPEGESFVEPPKAIDDLTLAPWQMR